MTELTLAEGWVSRKSTQMRLSRHAWQKRFTTLKQQSLVLASERLNKYILFFYKTPPSTSKEKSKPTEHILVQDIVRVHMFGHETGRFNLACRGQKLLELKTESDAETLKWCSSLCSHIKLAWVENKKDKVPDSAYQEVLKSQDRDKALSLLATGSFFFQHHDAGQRERLEAQSEEKERIGSEKEFVFCFWPGGEGPGGLVCAEPRVAAKAGTAPKPIPIDSIKEIRLGKQTKPWLSPLASTAVDLHCISFVSSVAPIHLEGASPEQVHWLLYCVDSLLKRGGKRLIEDDAGHYLVADPKTLKPKGVEGAKPPPAVDVATMDFPAAVLQSNKQKDKFQALLSLEERFEGKVQLVREGRVLVHQGKLGIKGTFTDSTYLFLLCNDMLICASTGLGALTWKLTTKFVAKIDEYFSVNNLLDGNKKSERNQFRIVTMDKTYVIQAKDADDKKEWMTALRKVIKAFKSSEEQKQKRKMKKLETEAQIKAEKEDRKREEEEAAAIVAHTKRMQQLQFEKLIEEEKGITNTEIIDDSLPDDDPGMEGIEGRIDDPEDSELEEGEPHPKSPKVLTPAGSSRTVASPSPVAATSSPRLDPSSSKSQLRSQPDLQALLAEATALLEDGLPGPPSPASGHSSSPHSSSHSLPTSTPALKSQTSLTSLSASPASSPALKPQSSVSRLESPASRKGKGDGFGGITGPPPEPDEPLPPLPPPGGSRPVSPAPGIGRVGSLTQIDPDSPGDESMISVTEWLTKLGKAYVPYAKAFEENGVDMRFLYSGDLTEDDLDELGVKSKIHRKKIMFTIETEIQERQKIDQQT